MANHSNIPKSIRQLIEASTKERRPSSHKALADLESGGRKLAGKVGRNELSKGRVPGRESGAPRGKKVNYTSKLHCIPGHHSLWLWCYYSYCNYGLCCVSG